MTYKLRKTLLGKYEVLFACVGCAAKITCPLDDAGTEQLCPSCGKPQRVPGEEGKRQIAGAAFLAEEVSRKQRVEEQRQRVRAIEEEAARRLKQSTHAQDVLAADQESIRTADWADQWMWKAFGFLRRLFALQVVLGMVTILVGVGLLAWALVLVLGQINQQRADYAGAVQAAMLGLGLIGAGYGLYVAAAMGATLVYIERNTRAILRS